MTASSLPEPHPRLPEPPDCRWRIRLELDDSEAKVAAAIDERGTIMGLATAGPTRDDDAPTAWELYSINIVVQQQGSGMADDLIRVVAGNSDIEGRDIEGRDIEGRDIEGRDTTVWVLAENARAQSFYRRHGFRVEGATRAAEVTGACETRMVRRSAKS